MDRHRLVNMMFYINNVDLFIIVIWAYIYNAIFI